MNRQQEERRGEGDIVDDTRRAELPHQERFSPLIKAEEGQHAGEEAAVDEVSSKSSIQRTKFAPNAKTAAVT